MGSGRKFSEDLYFVSCMSVVTLSIYPLLFSACLTHAAPPPVAHSKAFAFNLDPYPTKPRLSFRPDGTFKITVFSDLHFGEAEDEARGPAQDKNSTRLMTAVLADEMPDYVVINGDLINGDSTFKENSTSYIDQILAPLNDAKIPFSCTHGNHDNQVSITHSDEIDRELAVAPRSYTRKAPPGVGGESGPGNYWVPIYKSVQDSAPSLVLWFFDSRGGRSPGNDSHPIPDFVDPSVATWIAEETAAMNAAWGPAEGRGALAFVHMAPHAIQAVQRNLNIQKNPGLNDDKLGQGSVQDSAHDAQGFQKDKPFWDALNNHVKNLHATISGHAHGNEWCAREPTKDAVFCFNKHSGFGGYSHAGWEYGVRNIVFASPDPTRGVDTWIRLEDGRKRAVVTLDGNFGR